MNRVILDLDQMPVLPRVYMGWMETLTPWPKTYKQTLSKVWDPHFIDFDDRQDFMLGFIMDSEL